MTGKVLIAGVLGLVGRAVLAHYEALPDWDIVALSRRAPDFPTRGRFISVDLADRADCETRLAGLEDVTHIVYAALFEKPALQQGWTEADQVATNLAMLSHLLDVVERPNPRLRHVTLLQGGKAYGAHLAQILLPAKESAPRHLPPNFYYAQKDLVRARQSGRGWTWTVLRPMILLGFALGSPMNIIASLGVYAALCRELDVPFRFPGRGRTLMEATDVRLLARAIAWAGQSPAAANQVFNVTNGDCFVWENVWPALSRALGFEPALAQPMPLTVMMADKSALWAELVCRHCLAPYGLAELAGGSWDFADSIFGYHGQGSTALLSTVKIRQAGFADCLDSETSMLWWLEELARLRVLPGAVATRG